MLVIKVTVLIISALIIIFSPDVLFRQLLLRGIRVTETKDSNLMGNLTKGKYQNETSLYYNQRLLIYNNDAIESENIHTDCFRLKELTIYF